METFAKLFGSLLVFVYHCFDRIVILGYIPRLLREENIVYFFRDLHPLPDGSKPAITKEMLRARTDDYTAWVENYARKHRVPMEWADRLDGKSKEDHVRPHLNRRQSKSQFGVYYIIKSMETGPSFRIAVPKFPTDDPNYRIVRSQRTRYTHLYFYILDPVLGPMSMCVGTFLPFHATFWINGHSFLERELVKKEAKFRKDDNAFLGTDDRAQLQQAADGLSAETIQKRLDYWSLAIGPKFSAKERAEVNLNRMYSIQQVEYCWNFIFKRNSPIHRLYERSCDLGLFRLTADKITQIFGFRKDRRMRGKMQSVMERLDHGHHVLRVHARNAVGRMYEKFSTLLRVEVLSNHLRDFGVGKSLENLEKVRQKLSEACNRLAGFSAETLDTNVEFALFQRLALPIVVEPSRPATATGDDSGGKQDNAGNKKKEGNKKKASRKKKTAKKEKSGKPAKRKKPAKQKKTAEEGTAEEKKKRQAKVSGIKLHDTRMIRMMEVFLHAGTRIRGWRTEQLRQAVIEASGLEPDNYTTNQTRYDLRKMRAHGLVERDGNRYAYRLTEKGVKAATMFVLFHKRVCGPLAGSLFVRKPGDTKPATKVEAAYRRADKAIGHIVELLAA